MLRSPKTDQSEQTMLRSPKRDFQFTRSISDLNWRFLLVLVCSLSIIVFLSFSFPPTAYFSAPALGSLKSLFNSTPSSNSSSPESKGKGNLWKETLDRSRIAVCLVGGARRFELTGPSIIERVVKEFPSSDVFVNTPLDTNSYKMALLKSAPRIAAVRIFKQEPVPETEVQSRVLTAANSPNGIQGLLQYFSLVEQCLTLIGKHEKRNNFTYDWIVRTRVDGYWTSPLSPKSFIPGHYVVPPGSSYGGLNDRLGVGDRNTSISALSRLSLIPTLDTHGFRQLNSEASFKAQLTTAGVPVQTPEQPFCVVSDRRYDYPPRGSGVPVVSLTSRGPMSGAKCRPCNPVCVGECVGGVIQSLNKGWSWTEWGNGRLELCDAHGEWEGGWERIFDRVAGKRFAELRKGVVEMDVDRCVREFEELMMKVSVNGSWEAPPVGEICRLGLVKD
ncbi:uncharacterized protein [Phyllobates terribilis]|uniref:uncharacterized protein n=1 Tax=Phyllobates terribilis TaxID=111132 RepID=UPI003CCB6EB8